MDNYYKSNRNDPKFWRTIKEDIKNTDTRKSFKQDWKNLRDFYLSTEQKKKLEETSRYNRWVLIILWLLKGMFYHLTPMRRILLIVSIFLIISVTISINLKDNEGYTNPLPGYLIITFILMLELKDKLIAHNELKEGKSVQLALLPEESPEIPGWDVWLYTRPAHEVGGDLVDFMPLVDNKYYLVLGDVAGKGLGAALLMAKLQSTLRAIAQDFKNLEDLGRKINTIFHRDSLPEKFASLVYLENRANSGTIRMLNAGHFPPLILKGSKIIETEKGAPAIGIMKDTKYTEQEVDLDNDEILFVYSDGLVEACNDHDEFFGDTNLERILQNSKHLSCNDMGENIMSAVDKFIGDTPLYDDLSMIILKRK
jgi:hypothetical protein